MLGTLNGALEVRGVSLPPDSIRATVAGTNQVRDGLPVLTSIDIHYNVRISAAQRTIVDRALDRHQSKCPTAATLAGAVAVNWTAEIDEVDA